MGFLQEKYNELQRQRDEAVAARQEPMPVVAPVQQPVSQPVLANAEVMPQAQMAPAPAPAMPLPQAPSGLDQAYNQAKLGAIAEADVEARKGIAKAEGEAAYQKTLTDIQAEQAKAQEERIKAREQFAADMDKAAQDEAAMVANRKDFWADKSTGAKVLAGISIFLGGLGGGENQAMKIINQAIDRDNEAFKQKLQARKDMTAAQRAKFDADIAKFGDIESYLNQRKLTALELTKSQLAQKEAQLQDPAAKAKLQTMFAQLDLQKQSMLAEQASKAAERSEKLAPRIVRVGDRDMVAPSPEAAKELRASYAGVLDAKQAIGDLAKILDKPSSALSPEERQRAESIQGLLVGKLREAIVGPGTMNENDYQRILKLIPNTSAIFQSRARSKVALETLIKSIDSGFNSKMKAAGMQ